MTAPDSRDSVAMRLLNDLHLIASQGETPDGDGVTVNVQLWAEKWADRLQALARGPQQAGGEDYSALKTRLRDSAMLSTLPEWCRKELEQGADAIAALQAEVARLRRERAELIDKLNGTPCAEVRWQQERERLQAALLEAGRNAERWRFLTSMDVGEYIGLVEYNNPDKLAHAIDAIRLVRDGDSGEG